MAGETWRVLVWGETGVLARWQIEFCPRLNRCFIAEVIDVHHGDRRRENGRIGMGFMVPIDIDEVTD
jgi:hypothetical protein